MNIQVKGKQSAHKRDWCVFKISPVWKRSGRLPVKTSSPSLVDGATVEHLELFFFYWDCIWFKPSYIILSLQHNIAQIFTLDVSQLQGKNTRGCELVMGSANATQCLILKWQRWGEGGCVHLFLRLDSSLVPPYCRGSTVRRPHRSILRVYALSVSPNFYTTTESFLWTWSSFRRRTSIGTAKENSSPFVIQVRPPTGTKDWRLSEEARECKWHFLIWKHNCGHRN